MLHLAFLSGLFGWGGGPVDVPRTDHAVIVCEALTRSHNPARMPFELVAQSIEGRSVTITFNYADADGMSSTASRTCDFMLNQSTGQFEYDAPEPPMSRTLEEIESVDTSGMSKDELESELAFIESEQEAMKGYLLGMMRELKVILSISQHPIDPSRTALQSD